MAESSVRGSSSQSKSLMWMMVGFFAGLTVLLGGGFLLANRVVRSMGLSAASDDKNTVHTPGGSVRLQKADQAGPGLPVYPRSSLELPDASSAGTSIKEAQEGISVAEYHSEDARDFVEKWYGEHLGPDFKRREASDSLLPDVFKSANIAADDIVFFAERGAQTRVVALSLDEEGTRISLIRVDKSPAATTAAPTGN